MNRLYVVGAGPGGGQYMLPIGRQILSNTKTVIAAKRFMEQLDRDDILPLKGIQDTIALIETSLREGDVAVAVSGDPLSYSFLKTIQKDEKSKEWDIQVVPGIGSLQMISAAFCCTLEESRVISVHGRVVNKGTVARAVYENKVTLFLCSKDQNPAWISQILLDYQLEEVKVCVGCDLTYETQVLDQGTPDEIAKKAYSGLCVVLVKNRKPQKILQAGFLRNEDFVRGKTPITKEEIRILAIQRLGLDADSVVWDLGAGTGSVAVECARQCPFGNVYAVEFKEDAAALIAKNKEKFDCQNLRVIEGRAIEKIVDLPTPNAVFIGGSTGEFEEIIEHIKSLKSSVRVVVAAVTMETLTEAAAILKEYPEYSFTQINISKSKELGRYYIMESNHPVTLIEARI